MNLSVFGDFGGAIELIFKSRETETGGARIGGWSDFGPLTLTHLEVTFASIAIALAIALPIGLWLGHLRKGGFLAVSVSNVGRAVPSIALLALFIAFIGFGSWNVIAALALLAIPPILTNTYVGITQVDRELIDAAKGQGLTSVQILRQVELPLALPLIFGGLKTSLVNVIATATIAPLAGVVTLGDPITSPAVWGPRGQIAAAILVALLAIIAEVGLTKIQNAVTPIPLRTSPSRANWRGFPKLFARATDI